MTRIAVIGTGHMGENHVRVLSTMPRVSLVGVYDADRQRARDVAHRYGTRAFATLDGLLEATDAVVIAVPTAAHAAVGLEALAANCHVLMEKPLAADVAEAQTLCDEARRRRRVLMTGFVERFNPAVNRLRQLLQGKELLYMNLTRVGPGPPPSMPTDIILDLAIHDIDLLLHVFGQKIKALTAVAVGRPQLNASSISFLLANDALAQLTTTWLPPYKVRAIEAATRDQLYRCNLIEQRLVVFERQSPVFDGEPIELHIERQEPLRLELAAFIRAVKGGKVVAPGIEGLQSLRVAHQCRAAAEDVLAR